MRHSKGIYSGYPLIDLANTDQLVYRSSTRRLEQKLDKLITEIRAGKRQGSVISTQSLESLSTDEKSLWRELRHEMEDVGISTAVIMDRKEFIIEWFKTAIAEGGLDEVCELSDGENVESERPSPFLGASTFSSGSDITARSPSPVESAAAQLPASPIQTVVATPRTGVGAGPRAQPPAQGPTLPRRLDAAQYPKKGPSDLRGLFRGLSRALKRTEELEKTSEGGNASVVGLNLLYSPEGKHEIE